MQMIAYLLIIGHLLSQSMPPTLAWVEVAVVAVGLLLSQRQAQVACWGSVSWSCSGALGVGIKSAWLPGWQSFAQGSQGPREGSSSCQLGN
jgi:hypothetical protein